MKIPAVQLKKNAGRHLATAYSLIEVMIALAIFFMAAFAILTLVSMTLKNARILQTKKGGNAGLIAANYYALSNKLEETYESGDFGDIFPDRGWGAETYEVSSNGLFQVDFEILRRTGGEPESRMSVLLFRPESQPGRLSGGTGGRR